MSFYTETLERFTRKGALNPAASTLVIGGGETDRLALLEAGFTNVVISNLDTRMIGNEFAPFEWAFLDGENLKVEEGEFEQIIVHLALHHFGSPHRGLLEMYRCAGKAVLAMENRDSLMMRLAVKLGLALPFEQEAVAGHGFQFGGLRNGAVPNAVYRWTEREVRKVLLSYDPAHKVPVDFHYGLRLPVDRVKAIANPLLRVALKASLLPFSVFARILPSQGNDLAILIKKGLRERQPWIDEATGTLTERSWQGR